MKKFFAFAALALVCVATTVNADSIVLSMAERATTAAETGGGAPEGTVYEFFATTDGDILAVNFVTTSSTGGDFYQNQFGSNNAPPNSALIPAFPAITADSWITTPGDTSVLGGGFPNNGDDTYGDTSNNGPQNNFKFATLTLPTGATGTFSGQFDIAGAAGVFSQNFSFSMGGGPVIPEPATLAMCGMGMIGLVLRRRNG